MVCGLSLFALLLYSLIFDKVNSIIVRRCLSFQAEICGVCREDSTVGQRRYWAGEGVLISTLVYLVSREHSYQPSYAQA